MIVRCELLTKQKGKSQEKLVQPTEPSKMNFMKLLVVEIKVSKVSEVDVYSVEESQGVGRFCVCRVTFG